MLVTFVVVNIYKSIVTEDTTAPLVSSPPKTFDHLASNRFQMDSSVPTSYTKRFNIIPQTMTNWRDEVSEFDTEINLRFSEWWQALKEPVNTTIIKLMARDLCPVSGNMSRVHVDYHYLEYFCPKHEDWAVYLDENQDLIRQVEVAFSKVQVSKIAELSRVVSGSQIADIIALCNKTAFVAPFIYIKSKRYLLNILGGEKSHLNQKPYLKGNDTIFSSRVYILIPKMGGVSDGFRGRIAKIMEAGFFQFWENFFVYLHTGEGVRITWEDKFLRQKLNSNILSVFIMLIISTGVCVIIFLVEIGIGRRNRTLEGVRICLVGCHTRGKYCYGRKKILKIGVKPVFYVGQN